MIVRRSTCQPPERPVTGLPGPATPPHHLASRNPERREPSSRMRVARQRVRDTTVGGGGACLWLANERVFGPACHPALATSIKSSSCGDYQQARDVATMTNTRMISHRNCKCYA
ncbi:hypothetical protein SPHINGO8AM_180136 [Sphingomonas sp. 8AM]|nr:hypothetical protein SPHINGO8AM_180136 [Sphingomonas sp. 8AM]